MATANGSLTGATAFAGAMSPKTNSRLLSLAPELRNRIYDFVFYCGDCETSLELSVATPPDKVIVLACQAIYKEKRKAHAAGPRNFWANTSFTISCAADDDGRKESKKNVIYIYNLNYLNIHHMRHFTLSTAQPMVPSDSATHL